jgi:hypothetical protein
MARPASSRASCQKHLDECTASSTPVKPLFVSMLSLSSSPLAAACPENYKAVIDWPHSGFAVRRRGWLAVSRSEGAIESSFTAKTEERGESVRVHQRRFTTESTEDTEAWRVGAKLGKDVHRKDTKYAKAENFLESGDLVRFSRFFDRFWGFFPEDPAQPCHPLHPLDSSSPSGTQNDPSSSI